MRRVATVVPRVAAVILCAPRSKRLYLWVSVAARARIARTLSTRAPIADHLTTDMDSL
jgi:hypothetical protein